LLHIDVLSWTRNKLLICGDFFSYFAQISNNSLSSTALLVPFRTLVVPLLPRFRFVFLRPWNNLPRPFLSNREQIRLGCDKRTEFLAEIYSFSCPSFYPSHTLHTLSYLGINGTRILSDRSCFPLTVNTEGMIDVFIVAIVVVVIIVTPTSSSSPHRVVQRRSHSDRRSMRGTRAVGRVLIRRGSRALSHSRLAHIAYVAIFYTAA